jgi:hypothetical protein
MFARASCVRIGEYIQEQHQHQQARLRMYIRHRDALIAKMLGMLQKAPPRKRSVRMSIDICMRVCMYVCVYLVRRACIYASACVRNMNNVSTYKSMHAHIYAQAECTCLHHGATHNAAVVCRRDMNTSCWFHSLQLIYASVHLISWTNSVTVTMTMSDRKTLRSCE